MIGSLFCVVLGALLLAIAITWMVGPIRLLAGLVAVPIMWALVLIALLAIWLTLRVHGNA
jgi:hypothetical protein